MVEFVKCLIKEKNMKEIKLELEIESENREQFKFNIIFTKGSFSTYFLFVFF